MVRNLAAVVSNYRDAGTSVFVAAYFVTGNHELLGIREAIGVQLRVVRLSVPLPDNERRLAADVTTERKEELREAARQITTGEGTERLIWVGNRASRAGNVPRPKDGYFAPSVSGSTRAASLRRLRGLIRAMNYNRSTACITHVFMTQT